MHTYFIKNNNLLKLFILHTQIKLAITFAKKMHAVLFTEYCHVQHVKK